MFTVCTSQCLLAPVCAVKDFCVSKQSCSQMNNVHNVYFSVPSHPSVCCKDFVCVIFTNEQCSQCVLLSVRSPQWLRGKWWSLKRHVPDYQEMDFQGKSILFSSLSVFHLSSAWKCNRSYGLRQSSLCNLSDKPASCTMKPLLWIVTCFKLCVI